MDRLLRARQRPIGLAVAHAGLVGAVEEVPVRHVEVDAATAAPSVEVRDDRVLHPLRVGEALLERRPRGSVRIPRIAAVVFQAVEGRDLEEPAQLLEVALSPRARERRCMAKDLAARLARVGVDAVVGFRLDLAAAEQRVATDLDAARMRKVCELLPAREIRFALVLDVEAAAEAEDDEFEADLLALLDRRTHHCRLGSAQMHHQRVLARPRRKHAIHPPQRERATVSIAVATMAQSPRATRCERRVGRDGLRGAEVGPHFEQALRALLVVDLRVVGRIGEPPDAVRTPVCAGHCVERKVRLDMNVRQPHVASLRLDARLSLDHRPLERREAIEHDRSRAAVVDLEPLAQQRQAVVELQVHIDAQRGIRALGRCERQHRVHPARRPRDVTDDRSRARGLRPCKARFHRRELARHAAECSGIGGQRIDPLRQQEGAVALPHESAHGERLAVDLDARHRLRRAQQLLTVLPVLQADQRCVRRQSIRRSQDPVVEHEIAAIRRLRAARDEAQRLDQPIGARRRAIRLRSTRNRERDESGKEASHRFMLRSSCRSSSAQIGNAPQPNHR